MNIVLIGYRGSGKSSVGKVLAERLGRDLVSTDAEIVRRAGTSIAEIVATRGWEYFRDLESEVCRDLGATDRLVIDTGGGAILRPKNVEILKHNGRLFWLTAPVDTLASRIGGDTNRPSLTGVKSFIDEIEEVLRERIPKYQSAADYQIDTENRSIESLVGEIVGRLDAGG